MKSKFSQLQALTVIARGQLPSGRKLCCYQFVFVLFVSINKAGLFELIGIMLLNVLLVKQDALYPSNLLVHT